MNNVLITGAAGGIGRMIRPLLRGVYPTIRLSDVVDVEPEAGEEFVNADLADMAQVERICAGMDGVIHLGASSVEDQWQPVLNNNIIGGYNLFEAARRQGVGRIVFATTNHVVGFYRRQRTIDHTVMPRPDSRYGVSKAFGEALGRMYADKYGLRVFNIRIGNVDARPADRRRLSIWISPRDLVQLMRIGLEHPFAADSGAKPSSVLATSAW
jgi:uronate dehydrogenase